MDFSESNNPSINVITSTTYSGTPSSTGPRPITIFHDNEVAIVEVPRPFPYKSQKEIPWDYNCNYTHQTAATDLTNVRDITRSRRCYAPDMTEKVVLERLLTSASGEQSSKEKERPAREKKR